MLFHSRLMDTTNVLYVRGGNYNSEKVHLKKDEEDQDPTVEIFPVRLLFSEAYPFFVLRNRNRLPI